MKNIQKKIKRNAFMIVAYLVKLSGLRNDAWYQEHLSRARHEKGYLRKQVFDHQLQFLYAELNAFS